MRTVSDTITRLASVRNLAALRPQAAAANRLVDIDAFGSNPGNLRARVYVPAHVADAPALVVVLHGCTQTAGMYDSGSGWSHLADELGFVVLFPEQRRENNPNLCFNWFSPSDTRRGSGEALSIRQMIAAVVRMHGVDESRIHVTGLSAGGAMTSVMLATYPDLFAGGAVIAGLPFGCATTVPEAFDRMRGHGGPGSGDLTRLVRDASDFDGPWPTLSVWHGDADATVSAVNADTILAQWRSVHGLGAAPTSTEVVDGHVHRVWHDDRGHAVIEEYRIRGMGHGTPIASTGDDRCGVPGPYMLEAGISSTRRVAAFWELGGAEVGDRAASIRSSSSLEADELYDPVGSQPPAASRPAHRSEAAPSGTSSNVEAVIENALRAAGLLR